MTKVVKVFAVYILLLQGNLFDKAKKSDSWNMSLFFRLKFPPHV